MRPFLFVTVASAGIALTTAAVRADFAEGNLVYIQGVAGPQNGYTYWGTNVDDQSHALGTAGQVFADSFSSAGHVLVTSWVNSPTSVVFSFDFSNFNPAQYSVHAIEILGLKNDGSLSSVIASQGLAYVQDGIKIRWDGLGANLAEEPKLLLTIEQVPAPGALGAMGIAAFAVSRRRRR